jgi:dihydroxyacetone kinase-like predicted kinase
MKIDNMREEHNELWRREEQKPAARQPEPEPEPAGERRPYGIISVSVGEGLSEIFRGIGADCIIEGGQTMNPSTDDMLQAISQVNADVIYILPNNKNIVMAARQAASLTEDKQVIVIGSTTIPQGITALISFQPEFSPEENTREMLAALETVQTCEVTYAVRDTHIDGFDIHEGDYLALLDGKLFGTDRKIDELLASLAATAAEREAEFINIFYGEDVSAEEAHRTEQLFAEKCPGAEISLLPGGQPVYYYIVSME